MNKDEVLDFLREVIPEMKDVEPEDIQLSSTIESLEFDSLDFVEIQLAIRKGFAVELQQENFVDGQVRTVDDLCAYVAARSNSAGTTVTGA